MSTVRRDRSGLNKTQTRQTLSSFNRYLGLRGVFENICAGTTFIFVEFALVLGVAREHIGVMTAVASGACILQIAGIVLNSRVIDKKNFVLRLALIEPLVMIAAVLLVPLLPESTRIYALGAAVFAAAASLHLTRPVTDEWVASAIPAGLRGRYVGRRGQLLAIVVIGTTLFMGTAHDLLLPTSADESSPARPYALAAILVVGGIAGFFAVLSLRDASMPQRSATTHARRIDLFRTFSHKPFRRYVLAMLIYSGPFFLAVSSYQVFNLSVLNLPKIKIAAIAISYFIVKVLLLRWFGKVLPRVGARRTTLLAGPLYVLFFFCYPLSAVVGPAAVFVGWMLAGIADAAFFVVTQSALYAAVPDTPGRPAYFAAFNLLLLGTYAVGAAVAIPILESLKGVSWTVFSIELGQFQIFYLAQSILMIPCLFSGLLFDGPEVDRSHT